MTAARPFPSLRITAEGLFAEGSFAEAQAAFLRPAKDRVEKLDALLIAKKVGVVAHYYMDPELQGVLAGCTHPHIHVSDSLVMADRAVAMAQAGMESIVVLGVDFMSENARAMRCAFFAENWSPTLVDTHGLMPPVPSATRPSDATSANSLCPNNARHTQPVA